MKASKRVAGSDSGRRLYLEATCLRMTLSEITSAKIREAKRIEEDKKRAVMEACKKRKEEHDEFMRPWREQQAKLREAEKGHKNCVSERRCKRKKIKVAPKVKRKSEEDDEKWSAILPSSDDEYIPIGEFEDSSASVIMGARYSECSDTNPRAKKSAYKIRRKPPASSSTVSDIEPGEITHVVAKATFNNAEMCMSGSMRGDVGWNPRSGVVRGGPGVCNPRGM